MPDLIVDPELEKFLPAASEIADTELERQLLVNGKPTDPIMVWADENIIVDGHRRYALCQKHSLPYDVEPLDFPDRDAVKRWIVQWQLARRNVSQTEQSLYRGKLALLEEHKVREEAKSEQPATEAVDTVAEQTGTVPRTVWRDREFARNMEKLPEDLQQRVIDEGASRKTAKELSQYTSDQQQAAVAEFDAGTYSTLDDAVLGVGHKKKKKPKSPPREAPARRKLFCEAEQRLGALKRTFDNLGDVDPDPGYQKAKGHLTRLSTILQAWKEPPEPE